MSDSPTPATRSLSPLWILLILPIASAIGWAVGQTPIPKLVEATAAVETSERTASATAPAGRSRPSITVTERQAAAPSSPSTESVNTAENPQAPSAEVSSWTTLDNAVAESRRNGKPILIDFSAEWCGPCQNLKRQVFDDWTHGRVVQSSVIPVSIVDRSRETGSNPSDVESLYQRYNVDAFPTLVVFSPKTGRTVRTQGFGGAEQTMRWITEAASAVR